MKCPYCGSPQDHVLETREIEEKAAIRRRRECIKCQGRYTTFERLETKTLVVLKRNNRRELFSDDKLFRAVMVAVQKRNISVDTIREIIHEMKQSFMKKGKEEVKSIEIGNFVMRRLKKIDRVAYIRFASVYKNFEDVQEFIDTADKLSTQK